MVSLVETVVAVRYWYLLCLKVLLRSLCLKHICIIVVLVFLSMKHSCIIEELVSLLLEMRWYY